MTEFIQGDNGYLTSCNGSDRISPKSPWEIRCGKLITSCECVKRNGLQNECILPNCMNKIKQTFEKASPNLNCQRKENTIQNHNNHPMRPGSIPPQKESPRVMKYGTPWSSQQNNHSKYDEWEPSNQNQEPLVGHQHSPQYQSQYQPPLPNLHPLTKSLKTEAEEKQNQLIDAYVARRNAVHEKEMICPEQCPESLLECNPLHGIMPLSNPSTPPQPDCNRSNFTNQQFSPVNPYNPQKQYIISHEPGGNAFPIHCKSPPIDPQHGNNHLHHHQPQQYVSNPSEMISPRAAPMGSTLKQEPVQYQMQPCCMQKTMETCCEPCQDPNALGQVFRPPCCDSMIPRSVPLSHILTHRPNPGNSYQLYNMPYSNGGNLPPSNVDNLPPSNVGNLPHHHCLPTNNSNIHHQHQHLPMNDVNTQNQRLRSANTGNLQNQPYDNLQYPNIDQMYQQPPSDPVCNCNELGPKAFSQSNAYDYQHPIDCRPPVDLNGYQYEQILQPQNRTEPVIQRNSCAEPLLPEPQELSEYPPQIRRYRLDGQECK